MNIILAYESGRQLVNRSQLVLHIHRSYTWIRRCIEQVFTKEIAEKIRIIYMGSVSLTKVSKIVDHQEVDVYSLVVLVIKSINLKSYSESQSNEGGIIGGQCTTSFPQ